MLRLVSAAVLAPILWATIKLAPASVFCLLVAVAIGIGCWELCRMLDRRGARSFPWLAVAAALAVAWSFTGHEPRFETVLPIVALTTLSMVLAMWRRDDPAEMLGATMGTLFPVVFVGLTLSYLIRLRGMPGEDGADLLILLFICVIFADTAAFYGGSNLGRRRMAPRISPNKSWEGALCGLAGSMGGGLLAHVWFFQRLPIHHALILGVVLGLAGIFGDLAESLVKRAAGVKDSSSLIPGHGGLLDRADSLLFAAPILYYYYWGFLQGLT
jgi:phosphatidate cytidylyltransferase